MQVAIVAGCGCFPTGSRSILLATSNVLNPRFHWQCPCPVNATSQGMPSSATDVNMASPPCVFDQAQVHHSLCPFLAAADCVFRLASRSLATSPRTHQTLETAEDTAQADSSFFSNFRSSLLNDYYRTGPSRSSQDTSLFTHHAARDTYFDPLDVYQEMREELLSGPNPLSGLNAAAVGGLMFDARSRYKPDIVNMLRNDMAPHADARAKALGLLVWLRSDLQDLSASDRPEDYTTVLALWVDFSDLCQKHPHIAASLGQTLEPALARKLWKGIYLTQSHGNLQHCNLHQDSLVHLWKLADLSSHSLTLPQSDVSLTKIFGLLAEAKGETPDSAFQRISRDFLHELLERGLLTRQQRHAASLLPLQQQPVRSRRQLTKAEVHLVVFFRSLVLYFTVRDQYADALSALLALLQSLTGWERQDQRAPRQRILPDQQPLVTHLMLKTIASEQTHIIDHVASMLKRTAAIPHGFNLPSNRQLLHSYLDFTLSPSLISDKIHHLTATMDILDSLVPDMTDSAQLVKLTALLPPRLLLQLLTIFPQIPFTEKDGPHTELRRRFDSLYVNLSSALVALLTQSVVAEAGPWMWTNAFQRSLLRALCVRKKSPASVASSAITLYSHLQKQEPQASVVQLSPSELLQLTRFATNHPDILPDPYHFGHGLISDFMRSRTIHTTDGEPELDHIDLTCLASACFRLGFHNAAASCYERMLASGIIPSWQDINAVLGQLSREDQDSANTIFKMLQEAGFRPHATTYISMGLEPS